eukprot:Gb_21264 [translate_table: standard]
MGRTRPYCTRDGLYKGPWTPEEDLLLIKYIQDHGVGHWRTLPQNAGLMRSGKSCRFRWMNYLRPDIKRGDMSADEEELIIRLHNLLGNRWSLIAGRVPGRTDNEVKNYWNTHLRKKCKRAIASNPIFNKEDQREEKIDCLNINYNDDIMAKGCSTALSMQVGLENKIDQCINDTLMIQPELNSDSASDDQNVNPPSHDEAHEIENAYRNSYCYGALAVPTVQLSSDLYLPSTWNWLESVPFLDFSDQMEEIYGNDVMQYCVGEFQGTSRYFSDHLQPF